MSLITCCPACGTMFKVVADQLKISEGWVRCGHCGEIFDATAHMGDGTAAAPAATAVQQEPPAARAPEEDPGFDPFADPAPPLPQRESEPDEPPATPQRAELMPLPITDETPESRLGLPSEDFTPPSPAQHEDVGFVRQARRKAFWRRPLVRAALFLLVLAGLAGLALQVALHERDRLAAAQPQLRPWLQLLCEQANCTVGPARQIEAIAIDSSAFNKLRNETYRLSFTLRNGAQMPVAVPSMELTLTDTQDQPVLRRVLSPAELGASSATIAANGEWSGVVALAVAPNGNGNGNGRIAGYRLLAFYP